MVEVSRAGLEQEVADRVRQRWWICDIERVRQGPQVLLDEPGAW